MTKEDDFLKKFADKKHSTGDSGSRYVIKHDKWDWDDWNGISIELRDLYKADDKITEYTPTGHEAMVDTFFSLRKARAELKKPNDIRPSFLVNRAIEEEAMKLKEHKELRIHSVGDIIGSGLACVAMEPELEILFDKLKSEIDKAQKIEEMLQELEGMQDDERSAQELIEALMEGGASDKRKQNAQDQLAKIQESMELLKQRLEQEEEGLESDLARKGAVIRNAIRRATEAALENANDMDSMETSWGLQRGTLMKLPAQKRIDMAKRISTPKFKRLARLIGPMVRAAMAEQDRKVLYAREEIYDLELGNDLSVLIPNEYMYLCDEELEWDFFRRYYEMQLLQYKLRGYEKVAKGAIIFCMDGSGSMAGEREISAKAVSLALLQIARRQHREFLGIMFGSPAEYTTYEFVPKSNVVTNYYRGVTKTMDVIEGVMDWAEVFFGSGTDFVTPLGVALAKLQDQFNKTGAVEADIVFCTDDECAVSEDFLDMLKVEKARLGFRIFGVAVGSCPAHGGTLDLLCDGNVIHVANLLTPDDLRPIFGAV